MKASEWAVQSRKKLEKRRRPQATQPVGTPNFLRYLAKFKAALADQNYEYGTLKLLADTDRISPVYNPYGKASADGVYSAQTAGHLNKATIYTKH